MGRGMHQVFLVATWFVTLQLTTVFTTAFVSHPIIVTRKNPSCEESCRAWHMRTVPSNKDARLTVPRTSFRKSKRNDESNEPDVIDRLLDTPLIDVESKDSLLKDAFDSNPERFETIYVTVVISACWILAITSFKWWKSTYYDPPSLF